MKTPYSTKQLNLFILHHHVKFEKWQEEKATDGPTIAY